MPKSVRPQTIENRWDILYRDYPEVYNEFAAVPKEPDTYKFVLEKFKSNLSGKIVADVGSGTGISTFKLAKIARKVIAIESEGAMLRVARKKAASLGLKNIQFIKSDARNIHLINNSVDTVVGFTGPAIYPVDGYNDFIREAERIIKNKGMIILLGIPPNWYGGELDPVINDKKNQHQAYHDLMIRHGFKFKDFYTNQEYKSLDKIIRTYGFIFGKKVINYLKKHNKTNIKWKFRVHYKRIIK
jgi:ubiquinone/menaquinone biosynthesis C-methylase UbiE